MAVASSNAEKAETSQSMDASPSGRASDAASESPSFSGLLPAASDQSNSSPSTPKDHEIQPQASQRSEEYRQLFRLPSKEVLIRDYNCALQENFLLQRVIPFYEVTSVRRAKAAGIFPTAIEIMAGEKKYFFTSFLSRDDAFKLIKDGLSQYGNGANEITDLQSTKLELKSQENGDIVIEKARSSKHTIDDSDFSDRQEDVPLFEDSKLPVEAEDQIVSSSGVQDNVENNTESVANTIFPSPGSNFGGDEENCDAPKVPDYYTKVAESKFPIRTEEFFSFFYSDDAVEFIESYHQGCGDKDFRCSSWYLHDKFGHARDVSFQHPIKIYFGAKFGSCREVQKYRVYNNSHLVIETSQEVTDVPYGDYFHVEGLWDVERDGDDSRRSCIVRVYINVAFTKKTMWKGKIVQTTIDEARDACLVWIKNAHELLKQKELEKEEGEGPASDSITNVQVCEETEARSGGTLEGPEGASDVRMPEMVGLKDSNHQTADPLQGSFNSVTTLASLFRKSVAKFSLSLKSQSQIPLLLVITFAMILILMQLSIVVLLSRPQKVQLIPQPDYSITTCSLSERKFETMDWLEKRIQHLKDEMLMIESLVERMRHEHQFLKGQLEDLEHLRRRHAG